jgi:hypothetical protein
MNCEGTAWKDAATLVWLDGAEAPQPWNRWDIGVASVEAWRAATMNGIKPDVALLLGDEAAAAAWLQAGHWASVRVVAAPKAVLEHIGLDVLNSLKIHNMFCLEEAIQLYPYLGKGWTPEAGEDAAKALVAAVLRYGRTFPVAAPSPVPQLQTSPTLEAPPQLILVTQYYRPEKARRAKEIDECLRQNVVCPYVDRIVLLNEAPDIPLPVTSPKITATSIGGRLTLQAVVRWIYDEAPKGSLVVFANSDIYLDDTWRTLWSVDMTNKFFSLLRWNDDPAGGEPTLFGPRPDSQDTWVVAADSVKVRAWDWAALDIPFGKGGCDNAFNVEFLRQKFLVVNPAISLKTHHVHASEIRNYDPRDIVDRPMYMYIHPSGLQDFRTERSMPSPAFKVEQPAIAIPCGPVATESQRRTWQTMSVKAAPHLQEGCVTLPVAVPVAEAANVFTHAEGLVSTYNSVLIGTTKAAAAAWEEMALSKVTASVDSDLAFVAPCPNDIAASPALYTLRYLAKILVMRGRTGELGEFMCDPAVANHTLGLFSWPTSTVPVLARTPHFQAFCRRALIWHPQDGAAAWVTSAEVDALRGALRDSWESTPTRPVRVVCFLEDQMIQALERALPSNVTVDVVTSATPFPEVINALRGATAFVFAGGPETHATWAAAWALPERATMVELQPEMRASAEAAHFAAVAGLDYALVPMPRGGAVQNVVARIVQALGLAKAAPASPMPIRPMELLMPRRDGFFGHAGDSFREMAELWAERGYVAVEPRDDICNVWLSGVGDTLLYDRPTMEWLNKSPIREKGWRRALFGNPAPAAQNAHAWTFWPRRPRLVEALVGRGVGGSLKRSKRLVFYGRSENAVQKERRSAADWATAFGPGDVFSHVEGSAPYPLTQEGYLEALADAKFGLCLAGYGYKCHREVECMAMGCVPIVAPEVDMDNYADPPKEGVHYLRAATPKAAAAAMASLSPAAWAAMSAACRAWWRRNASVEGSWTVTKRVAGL